MKKTVYLMLAALLLLTSCASVPLTGRKRVMLMSDADVISSSLTQYNEYIKSAKRSSNAQGQAQMLRVGRNIATATEKFMKENGMADDIALFGWEFTLVEDDELNAFCMPGGKIVVFDGLLKLAVSDAELATVIGHEVAHSVAKHSSERLSQQMMAQYGAYILSATMSQKSEAVQALSMQVYGLGAELGVMLPFSRQHEYEADYIGQIFMAMAGYDPAVAVSFWEKMVASGSGAKIPALLSSHPSDEKRIAKLKENIPTARQYYKK